MRWRTELSLSYLDRTYNLQRNHNMYAVLILIHMYVKIGHMTIEF